MLDVLLFRARAGARFATGLELSDRKYTRDACSRIPPCSPRREGKAVKHNAGALHSQAAITFESVLPWS